MRCLFGDRNASRTKGRSCRSVGTNSRAAHRAMRHGLRSISATTTRTEPATRRRCPRARSICATTTTRSTSASWSRRNPSVESCGSRSSVTTVRRYTTGATCSALRRKSSVRRSRRSSCIPRSHDTWTRRTSIASGASWTATAFRMATRSVCSWTRIAVTVRPS